MLRALSAVLQFLVFFLVFLAVSFWAPLHLQWFVTHPTPTATRFFVPDGLLAATAIWLLLLGAEAAAKRLRTLGGWTTVAFAAALICGFLLRFGFVTRDGS